MFRSHQRLKRSEVTFKMIVNDIYSLALKVLILQLNIKRLIILNEGVFLFCMQLETVIDKMTLG